MKKLFLVICLVSFSSSFCSIAGEKVGKVVVNCYKASIPISGIAGAVYNINGVLDDA